MTFSERQEMDTAMRCLQLVLHPNTGVGERMAGIDGYLRKAKGRPVIGICIELYGKGDKIRLKEQNQQLLDIERENLRLQEMWQQETERADRAEEKLLAVTTAVPAVSSAPGVCDARVYIKVRWSAEEYDFLARLYEADPHMQSKVFAARFGERFGRDVTTASISSSLDRLRRKGRLPRYRPGRAKCDDDPEMV